MGQLAGKLAALDLKDFTAATLNDFVEVLEAFDLLRDSVTVMSSN